MGKIKYLGMNLKFDQNKSSVTSEAFFDWIEQNPQTFEKYKKFNRHLWIKKVGRLYYGLLITDKEYKSHPILKNENGKVVVSIKKLDDGEFTADLNFFVFDTVAKTGIYQSDHNRDSIFFLQCILQKCFFGFCQTLVLERGKKPAFGIDPKTTKENLEQWLNGISQLYSFSYVPSDQQTFGELDDADVKETKISVRLNPTARPDNIWEKFLSILDESVKRTIKASGKDHNEKKCFWSMEDTMDLFGEDEDTLLICEQILDSNFHEHTVFSRIKEIGENKDLFGV